MLCFGVSDLIYKRGAAAGFAAGEFLMAQAWISVPASRFMPGSPATLHPHPSALWGSLAGFFLFVALYNFIRSLQGGAVSTNAPIFRLNFTITAALAILFLGETLTVAKALRSPARSSRCGCCSPKPAANAANKICLADRVLIATVAMALINLFYKVGLQHGALPETMVAAQAWMFCSLATLFVFVGERRSASRRRLALRGRCGAGAVRRLRAADARARARAGKRARAGGANELRVHGPARCRDVPRTRSI